MHGIKEAPTSMMLEMDTAQKAEEPRHRPGCMGIVFGFTAVSILIFVLFGYPHYQTSRAWLFWSITVGLLLAESFVIYLASFVSRVVRHEGGGQ